MEFLYKIFDTGSRFNKQIDNTEIPDCLTKNLSSIFKLRPYQQKAFSRFIYFINNGFDDKQAKPYQLMFNMATDSGKTMIMAGLFLYLYKQGYRKFLFFVNSTNIINKTIDNFINTHSSKYLFNKNGISFDGKRVNIKQVDNFEDAGKHDINICFTTIQKLHSDIYAEKENSLTLEDFKEQKIVFISDEAHHINTKTINQTEIESLASPSWENTIEKISLKKTDKNQLIEQQYVLNSLEDKNNPIRAIFAVNKLNEGWDVLNLFDIVRLYKTRDTKNGKVGKTTMEEAQLIRRGERYFPFKINKTQDKFKRKFDKPNNKHELKTIEELHYHTIEDSKYISELKKALVESGIYNDENDYTEVDLRLKEKFKDTVVYKKAVVFENEKKKNKYEKIQSFSDLGVSKTNISFKLHSGQGKVTEAFDDNKETKEEQSGTTSESKDVKVNAIPLHIVKNAIARNDFFQVI